MSETELINTTQMKLERGSLVNELVTAAREHLRTEQEPRRKPRKRRTVAVVASAHGQGAHVVVPVRQPVQPPADWPTADEIDAIIGTACYGFA